MTASVLDRHFTDHDTSNASKPVTEASVLPLQCYTDEQFYRDEIETVMMRSWLPVGREDQVANTGDYFTVDLFGESVVIVRGSDNEIRALSNVCRHRATQVVDNGSGNKPAFVCPYHTWSYNLDGTLRAAPHMDEAAGFDRANCRLPAFPLERWNGFLFLNFDADAQPLRPQIAPLTAELEPYRLAERKSTFVKSLDCDWNWKVSMENFTEAYHHIGIHLNSVEPYAPANKTVYEDTNNAYSLFWMFAADDDHYLSSLFPEIPELQGKYRNSGVANVYPFLHLLLAPGRHPVVELRTRLSTTTSFGLAGAGSGAGAGARRLRGQIGEMDGGDKHHHQRGYLRLHHGRVRATVAFLPPGSYVTYGEICSSNARLATLAHGG